MMGTPVHSRVASSIHYRITRQLLGICQSTARPSEPHLMFDVIQGIRGIDGKSNQDDMCFRVGEGT